MPTSFSLISDLVIIFFIAFAGALTAKKLHQPVLTGYILVGILAGGFLGRFFRLDNAQSLADLGLTFLMFVVGLDFSLRRLARVKEIAVFGSIAQMGITTLVLMVLGKLFLFPSWNGAELFLGAVVFSLSSTAIVIKFFSERGELDTLPSEIIVGWLLVQDLAVVPVLTLLPVIAGGGGPGMVFLGILVSLIKSAVLLYLVLLLGKRIIPRLLTKVAQANSREVLLIAVVGLVLLSASVTSALGLSFALGAFLAGLLISDSISQHAIFSEIRPLRDVFVVVFFVTLGTLISPSFIQSHLGAVLLTGLTVIVVKLLISLGVTLFFRYHLKTALQIGLYLAQVSEFAFVVSRVGLGLGVVSQDTYSLILTTTVFTMMVAPFQFGLSVGVYERLRDFFAKWSPRIYKIVFSGFDRYKRDHQEISLANHVVICGHGRVGKHIARVLAMAGIPYVVVDYNHTVVADLLQSGVETVLGDPTDRDVLDFAGTGRAAALVVAVPDRYSQELIIQNAQSLRPGIVIVCRSHFEEDRRRLYALGVTAVVSPEFEAGLSMGHRILDALGVDKQRIMVCLRQTRKEQLS